VELVSADDMTGALQLSDREFKGNAIKIEVSQRKPQQETPAKAQQKTGKAGKAGKDKTGGQEQSNAGKLDLVDYPW